MEESQEEDESQTGHFAEKFQPSAFDGIQLIDVGKEVVHDCHKAADTDPPDKDTEEECVCAGRTAEDLRFEKLHCGKGGEKLS